MFGFGKWEVIGRYLTQGSIRFTGQGTDFLKIFQNLPRLPDKPLMVFNHNIYLT